MEIPGIPGETQGEGGGYLATKIPGRKSSDLESGANTHPLSFRPQNPGFSGTRGGVFARKPVVPTVESGLDGPRSVPPVMSEADGAWNIE